MYLDLADGQPTAFPWPRITLDLLPPRRGSRVWSWGHISPRALLAGPTLEEVHWYATLARSSGLVQEIFPSMRDRGLVNFPAFQFDARVDGSMSGGPVFDEEGHLVGINSSSLPPTGDNDRLHTSTAALLWPVPALAFTPHAQTPLGGSEIRFVEDLHLLGFLPMINHSAVHVDREVSTGELHVRVSIPEDRV